MKVKVVVEVEGQEPEVHEAVPVADKGKKYGKFQIGKYGDPVLATIYLER